VRFIEAFKVLAVRLSFAIKYAQKLGQRKLIVNLFVFIKIERLIDNLPPIWHY